MTREWTVEHGDKDHNPWVVNARGERIAEVWGPLDKGSEAYAELIVASLNGGPAPRDDLDAIARIVARWVADWNDDPEDRLPERSDLSSELLVSHGDVWTVRDALARLGMIPGLAAQHVLSIECWCSPYESSPGVIVHREQGRA